MSSEIWFAYIATVLVLMLTPGPSQLLMLSNSMSHGFTKSSFTAMGDLTANAIQMLIAAAGLATILYTSQYAFIIIKWLGVAYLIYMGVRQFFKKTTSELDGNGAEKSIRALFMQGFVTSASNPKAIIFFAALFPQFVDPANPTTPQFAILGLTYLIIDGFFLSIYGIFASWISKQFSKHVAKHLNRISGSFLILAAILLGLKKVNLR